MNKILFLLSIFIFMHTSNALHKNTEISMTSEYFFGVNLKMSGTGKLLHFFIVRVFENGEIHTQLITEDNFMRQVGGEQESKANPNKENFWAKYQVDYMVVYDLWRLRFNDYPYHGDINVDGWAGGQNTPTPGQLAILKEYGFNNLGDIIYGENLFKLLYFMQDQNWVDRYKAA